MAIFVTREVSIVWKQDKTKRTALWSAAEWWKNRSYTIFIAKVNSWGRSQCGQTLVGCVLVYYKNVLKWGLGFSCFSGCLSTQCTFEFGIDQWVNGQVISLPLCYSYIIRLCCSLIGQSQIWMFTEWTSNLKSTVHVCSMWGARHYSLAPTTSVQCISGQLSSGVGDRLQPHVVFTRLWGC